MGTGTQVTLEKIAKIGVQEAAAARHLLSELEVKYTIWKNNTVHELVGSLNADTNKPHTITSAEAEVRMTSAYESRKNGIRDQQKLCDMAQGMMQCAFLEWEREIRAAQPAPGAVPDDRI